MVADARLSLRLLFDSGGPLRARNRRHFRAERLRVQPRVMSCRLGRRGQEPRFPADEDGLAVADLSFPVAVVDNQRHHFTPSKSLRTSVSVSGRGTLTPDLGPAATSQGRLLRSTLRAA